MSFMPHSVLDELVDIVVSEVLARFATKTEVQEDARRA
jgi:hypothetical protein